MKIEVYIPDHETEVIERVMDLKTKRKLSQEVVELLKGKNSITKEEVISLIRQYSNCYTGRENERTNNDVDLMSSITSVLGGLK